MKEYKPAGLRRAIHSFVYILEKFGLNYGTFNGSTG
jgi:hypothetical protein